MAKNYLKKMPVLNILLLCFMSIFFVACHPEKSDLTENLPPMLKINETMFGVSFQFPCSYDNIKKLKYSLYNTKIKMNRSLTIKVVPKSKVLASSKGVIEKIEISKKDHYYFDVTIRHSSNIKSVYSMLDNVKVNEGAKVKSGEIIAISLNKFIFQIFVRKDFFEHNTLTSYIETQNKSELWIDVFPLLLIFGEDSYNAKNN